MDTSDPEISFDNDGICNHCRKLEQQRAVLANKEMRQERLEQIVAEIKDKGRNKAYDCIIGVSGGTDSTYVAYIVKQLGLRPLAVHVDNGWDAELAVGNIENTLKKLEIDLFTYVIDWEEFRDFQKSLLKASVTEAELPTDHAIRAVLNQVAIQYGIKYIVNGRNFNTEGILPWSWSYSVLDWKYLKGIHRQFGTVKLKKYPHFNLFKLLHTVTVKRIKLISILNYVDYNKNFIKEVLKEKLEWRDYGGKHYESIYTRFFQAYILPTKFNIDKRRAHLSVLVTTGQMERQQALAEVSTPAYTEDLLQVDREYVLKKLGMDSDTFNEIMASPVKSYADYANHAGIFLLHKNIKLYNLLRLLKKIGILPKGFADYATYSGHHDDSQVHKPS